jgi:hypothetical protein
MQGNPITVAWQLLDWEGSDKYSIDNNTKPSVYTAECQTTRISNQQQWTITLVKLWNSQGSQQESNQSYFSK